LLSRFIGLDTILEGKRQCSDLTEYAQEYADCRAQNASEMKCYTQKE
jgi:hypothetical protein